MLCLAMLSSMVILSISFDALGLEDFNPGGCLAVSSVEVAAAFEGEQSAVCRALVACCPVDRPEYKPPGNDHDPPTARHSQQLGSTGHTM